MPLVFVYGSLMTDGGNNSLLGGSSFVGRVCTNERYRMIDFGWYPAVVPDPGGERVHGELWEVDDATLARLDKLEGHPNFYRRTATEMPSPFKTAWMYVLARTDDLSDFCTVPSCDWRERMPK